MSAHRYWDSLLTLGAEEVAAGSSATFALDLEAAGYDLARCAFQVVFGATVDGNVIGTLYNGLSGGDLIDTVGDATGLTATAATSSTVILVTDVVDSPYARFVFTNNDSAATVSLTAYAQGHYEAHNNRLV